MRTTSATPTWELRYTWQTDPGVVHPEHSFEKRGGSREDVETYALGRWERGEQHMTITAVAIRQLPGGEFEHLLPIEAPCEVRPGGYIGQEATAP